MAEYPKSFDSAEYLAPQSAPRAQEDRTTLLSDTFGFPASVGSLQPDRSVSAPLTRGIVYGCLAAVAGCLLYAGFTIVTHIQIGYVALGVGWLVGKAMLAGSGGRGGRPYQATAVLLTYLAVSMAAVPELLWSLYKAGTDVSHLSGRGMAELARYGVLSPFLELRDGLGALIGLFILFVGMRAAWQITRPTGAPGAYAS